MAELIQTIWATLARIDLRSILDILIVGFLIYWLLLLLRGTTAMTLLRGIVILFSAGFLLGNLLQLTVLNWILRNSVTALLVAIPILFQPELRRALERIGRTGIGFVGTSSDVEQCVEILSAAATLLASRRFGALIVVERETGLQEYVDTGVPIDAALSVELLASIYFPNSPLHDGAVIIRGNRILAARCVLPLSDNLKAGAHLGTRHRAGIGISERTDAIAIIISEERSTISVAADGHIAVQPDETRFRRSLAMHFGSVVAQPFLSRWRKAS